MAAWWLYDPRRSVKILVTGAAGLIGMAVRPALRARGHDVIAIDITDFGRIDPDLIFLPLTEPAILDDLATSSGIEAIIHCGAISGPMLAKGKPLALVEANIVGTAILLDLARRHGMRRFVFCSSISVYGNVGPATITETTPLAPTSVYGATKVASEQLVQGFAAEYELDGVSLRIARVYGAYRRANCFIGAMIRDAMVAKTTEVPCDPAFVYHYVYVGDVVAALIAALEAKTLAHREYNVGAGEALTMPQVVETARAVLPDLKATLVPGADEVPDVQTVFDISRATNSLGFQPRFDLARGIAAYHEAILAGMAAGG
jgi:UDP-glucose 4-epimerase